MGSIAKSRLPIARDQAQKAESSTGPSTSDERVSTISLASHEKAIADKDAVEAAIRNEADPRGLYSRDLIDTAGLVKNIRKRHRDSLEEIQRVRDAMQTEKDEMESKCEDEKYCLNLIILEQSEKIEQDQQMREDYDEIQSKYSDLLANNEDKTTRIRDLKEQVEDLKKANRRVEDGVSRIQKEHKEKLEELRGSNVTLQDRLNIAERLQSDLLFHKSQVGTVNEMHQKLVLLKQAKKDELSVKEDKIKELDTTISQHEKDIQYLKITADVDKEELKKTTEVLRETREALRKAEGNMGSHQEEVRKLNWRVKVWDDRYRAKSQQHRKLELDMDALRGAQRNELIEAQAKNEVLQVNIDCLRSTIERLDPDFASWEKAYTGSMGLTKTHHNGTLPGTTAESLAKALKAANARANALQINVDALQAENGVLQKRLGNVAQAYDPKVQEQLKRLRSENQMLSDAAGQAETLKTQLIAQSEEQLQKLNDGFAKRTRELEAGFDQGFESLRRLRDQWLLHKRDLEQAQNRDMLAADLRRQNERQGREDRFMAACRGREEELRRKEHDLQSRETDVAERLRNIEASGENLNEMRNRAETAEEMVRQLQASGQNFDEMKNRAENAEEGMRQLQHQLDRKENDLQNRKADVAEHLRNLQASGENLNEMRNRAETAEEMVRQLQASGQNFDEMKDRAENAEEMVLQLQTAAMNNQIFVDWREGKLNDDIMALRRDVQRRSDLLNEEISTMAQESRLLELHEELQIANCSIDLFKFEVVYNTTSSQSLSQRLNGADFYESDVRLLQAHGRPVLLAQLQAARLVLGKLRSLLSRSPNVEVDKVVSILVEPRGDENAAQPVDDIFDEWNQSQHHPANSRKRSGVPLGPPNHGNQEDSTAYDDWAEQQVLEGTRVSTPQEISNRPRHQPKSRRTRVIASQSVQST